MITVLVCTLNRCQILAKTLGSVAVSALPAAVEWEVLVIDNNSTDETRTVVEEFTRRYDGRFRYVFESQPGKSFALNRGIREAKGDILVFTDDDVTFEANWLHNLTEPLKRGEWAGVGGRTLLAETFDPPRWMAMEGPFNQAGILAAVFDLGSEACELKLPPYGANMAFRKEMFEKYGLFRTDLGPSPNQEIPRPNEDTEFGRRLLTAGERLRYEASAVVYHPVMRDRVRKQYFLSWWFDFGRALIREKGPGPDLLGIPRYYLSIPKMAVVDLLRRAIRWTCTLDPLGRFSMKCLTWAMTGQIVETYRLAKNAKRRKTQDMVGSYCK